MSAFYQYFIINKKISNLIFEVQAIYIPNILIAKNFRSIMALVAVVALNGTQIMWMFTYIGTYS